MQQAQFPLFHAAYLVGLRLFKVKKYVIAYYFMWHSAGYEVKAGHCVRTGRKTRYVFTFKFAIFLLYCDNNTITQSQALERKKGKLFFKFFKQP